MVSACCDDSVTAAVDGGAVRSAAVTATRDADGVADACALGIGGADSGVRALRTIVALFGRVDGGVAADRFKLAASVAAVAADVVAVVAFFSGVDDAVAAEVRGAVVAAAVVVDLVTVVALLAAINI